MRIFRVLLLCALAGHGLSGAEVVLAGPAAELYRQAEAGRWFAEARALKPEVRPTSDGKSFIVVWKAVAAPKRWIVSLHGTHGFATDDLGLWHGRLKGRDVGLICVQWWLGAGDQADAYYSPMQLHREIDVALERVGARGGAVMLHGFSRGAANAYAVVALDAGPGKRYFSLAVASSGGVALDFPPTRAIGEGGYGVRPLEGTRWVTAAGAGDAHPERDGIEGMRRTATWLKEQGGAVVMVIEDPTAGHGALMLNGKNLERVLDLFLTEGR